jgi:AraC-like DNA-binding protein
VLVAGGDRTRSTPARGTPYRRGVQVLLAATARALLAGFGELGLDVAALRRAALIGEADLARPDEILPGEAFQRLWGEAFRQAPRDELPTELGLAIPFGAFGALDYLAGSSPTVEAAFHALRGHFRQVARLALEIDLTPSGADVRLLSPEPFPGQEISDEMTLAILVGRFRGDAAAPFRPSAVRLTRPPPRATTRHAALLQAPVAFGCSAAGLAIPLAAWTAPMRRADPALQETLRQLAARLDLGGDDDDLVLGIRARLRTLLPDGKADAASVARTLGLSERTLHRRLQEAGKTWRGVLDTFREAEAERLLASGRAGLSEVALRLGFSDQTAWNRAFRRWKGMSPTTWLRARSDPGDTSPRR